MRPPVAVRQGPIELVDMAELLHEATADLTRLCPDPPDPPDPVALHGRFLGWVRRLTVDR
ncbi:hypothetical protein [Micromonospora sp. RP3T]|uniref:hypothetical protein n=1 Tax=Micromonospora sp. RP3T TaxID=2135446 RepID=UPI003D72BC7D